jgi:hypothetical protein
VSDEPITFVVERRVGGGEVACVYYDRLPERLTRKGQMAVVYQVRLDRLEPEHRRFWLSKSTRELLDVYRWLRDEGTLPPPNLADPPRKDTGEKGTLHGEHWQPPLRYWDAPDFPRDQRQPPPLAPHYDAPAYIGPRGRYLHLVKGPADE